MADEKNNVILLKEAAKDIVENNEIVIDKKNAIKLFSLKKAGEEIQNQFNIFTGIILDMHGAEGKYNAVFNDSTGEVKLVKESDTK